MFLKRSTSILIIALLLTGFFFLSAPEQSHAGLTPIGQACCQFPGGCFNFDDDPILCDGQVIENATCNEDAGVCVSPSVANPIPTLSEWGLIAMAGVLGIAGYLIVRRRRVNA
jgi:hypothetical protein